MKASIYIQIEEARVPKEGAGRLELHPPCQRQASLEWDLDSTHVNLERF